MIKIAIFTEGQTELIFVREFLLKNADLNKISFECLCLNANCEIPVPYSYKNPHSEVHFFILNVGNDNKVLSSLLEREKSLFQKGFDRIIAIRDMYSNEYKKFSKNKIVDTITDEILTNTREILKNTSNPGRIGFYFAVMEIEAWILGMYNLFGKLDAKLTVDYIQKKLGFNVQTIDPQKEFFRPSEQIGSICALMGMEYKKKRGDVEMLCSQMSEDDYLEVLQGGRCDSFGLFKQDIENLLP